MIERMLVTLSTLQTHAEKRVAEAQRLLARFAHVLPSQYQGIVSRSLKLLSPNAKRGCLFAEVE